MAIGKITDVQLTAKTQEFSGFLRDLEKKLTQGTTMRQVTDYEVAKVLEMSVELTGKADEAKIRSAVGGLKVITLNGKKQGLFNKKRGQFQHFGDALWGKITRQRKLILHRKLLAVGLTKQSWWLIAQLMGYDVKAPNYVKTALPSRGRSKINPWRNVSIRRDEPKNGRYGIEIWNRMPLLDVPHGPQGVRAFFAAIAGRIGFFRRNLSKGVYDDAKKVAAKYPGIKVSTTGF